MKKGKLSEERKIEGRKKEERGNIGKFVIKCRKGLFCYSNYDMLLQINYLLKF